MEGREEFSVNLMILENFDAVQRNPAASEFKRPVAVVLHTIMT